MKEALQRYFKYLLNVDKSKSENLVKTTFGILSNLPQKFPPIFPYLYNH